MRIQQLTLATGNPVEQKKFYCSELGFPEIEIAGDSDGFSFQSGYTKINFIPGDKDARYHFAFNVRPDQFESAIGWIENEAELLENPHGKGKIVDFPNWNAKSVYFFDPAGNIVEIIARAGIQRAGNAPKFSTKSLTGISEIGIACEDVLAMREWISNVHGIHDFTRQENTAEFSAMGDDEGLLLLVPKNRPWFMGNFDAVHFPLAIEGINSGKDFKLMLP
jgi:catechol-2,3-dioxygenase